MVEHLQGPFSESVILDVFALDRKYFDLPWDLATWQKLGDTYFLSLLRNQEGQVQAFALFQCLPFDDMAHLLKILVEPTARRQGLAEKLLRQAIDDIPGDRKRVFLEVSDQNIVAERFYSKFGFERLNHMKCYYSNGEGAYSMELVLKKLVKQ